MKVQTVGRVISLLFQREGGAGAEASEEIEEEVTEVEVETVGRLISLRLQREEEAPGKNQIAASSPEADLLIPLILLILILTHCGKEYT